MLQRVFESRAKISGDHSCIFFFIVVVVIVVIAITVMINLYGAFVVFLYALNLHG